MRITHQQIADKLGISRVTVSQVLNKSRTSRVSPGTQREVLRVAQELRYEVPNRTTHAIGYVVSVNDLHLDPHIRLLQEMHTVISRHNMRLVLTEFDPENPAALRDTLNPKTVDAVIFTRWYEGQVRDILAPEIPWIMCSDEDEIYDEADTVTSDTIQMSFALATHLLEKGHRRLCLVTGQTDVSFHRHIEQGIVEAIRQHRSGAELSAVVRAGNPVQMVEPLLAAIKSDPVPDALFAMSSIYMVSALNILQSEGLRVSEDISAVALFDSQHFEALRPSITAMEPPYRAIATQVVERLMERLKDPEIRPRKMLLPGELVERKSVANRLQ